MFRCLLLCCLSTVALADAPIPRPEHPQPEMERSEWLNLNGTWDFAESDTPDRERYLSGAAYPDTIVVPFCRESALSGLARKEFVKNVWYRRTFSVPSGWQSERIRLHIGASDWRTTVWVNGEEQGTHVGGNAPFWFDVTDAVDRGGENTITIHVFDDTASGLQPLGKQSIRGKSYGIFYTPTTGIWQTVWLEGVGETFVEGIRIEPRPESSAAILSVELDGDTTGLHLRAEVHVPGQQVARSLAPARWRDNKMLLSMPNARLWSPEDPFLYNLKVEVVRGETVVDSVASYFGMRDITIDGNAILLNGQPVFQRLVLDQGFYPDGLWTAPSDAALKRDIELAMAAGFNGARLHQKVFEPRFLYWADVLGYLVWGEYPSYGANYANPEVDSNITREWVAIVERDRNHPAIIGWCPFNETPPAAGNLQHTILDLTRALDPTRPALETSGWTHTVSDPEVLDAHDYDQNPDTFRSRWTNGMLLDLPIPLPERYPSGRPGVPFFISEYGGIGWSLDEDAWGYGNVPENLEAFHARFEGLTNALLDNPMMFGLCYTQLTDIEQEQNGVYRYDRSAKFDVERLRKVMSRRAAYEEAPPTAARLAELERPGRWETLVGSVHDGDAAAAWRYTTDEPSGGWPSPEFDDEAWSTGHAPFGLISGDYGDTLRTKWREDDLWVRQTFDVDSADLDHAVLLIYYDDDTEVYLNGERIWSRPKWSVRYESFVITEAVRGALRVGTNTIAAHVHQDAGGQFFDMALLAGYVEKPSR